MATARPLPAQGEIFLDARGFYTSLGYLEEEVRLTRVLT